MTAAAAAQSSGVTIDLGGYRADAGATVRAGGAGIARARGRSAEGETAEIVVQPGVRAQTVR